MFKNLLVFNTRRELLDYIDTVGPTTLVAAAAFAGDLLESVRHNDNVFEIVDPVDDGCWIEIDEMGYVVADMLND
jgi:hypothetical protein